MPNAMYNMASMSDPKKIAAALGAEHVGHVEARGGHLGAAQNVADVQGLRGRVPASAAVAEYAQAFSAWDDATMRWIRQRDEFLQDRRLGSDVWTLEPGHESELLERIRRCWAALSPDEQQVVELAVDLPALRLGVYVQRW